MSQAAECERCGRIPNEDGPGLSSAGYCPVCFDLLEEQGPDAGGFDSDPDPDPDPDPEPESDPDPDPEPESDHDMTDDETEICGATQNDDSTCTYSASYPDGRCGHHTEHEDDPSPSSDQSPSEGARADGGESEASGEDDQEESSGRGRGRPSKYNSERSEAAIEAAKRGKSKAGCARSAGVDEHTLERWLDAHDDFRSDFRRARAIGEDKLIEDGMYDPEADSQMARFLLSSSFKYKKASKQEVEHTTGPDGFDFNINVGSDGSDGSDDVDGA